MHVSIVLADRVTPTLFGRPNLEFGVGAMGRICLLYRSRLTDDNAREET
jgi:hypothetical protein